MNYDSIKTMAKEHGLTVGDLCALAPKNDPFYTGRSSQVEQAHWFADLWQQFGYSDGVHLRRVHYRVISQDPPMARHNGQVYQNTENDWNYLCDAGKYARYLGLISPGAFVDRRNPEALLFTDWLSPADEGYDNPEPGWMVTSGWDEYEDEYYYRLSGLPELPLLPQHLPQPPTLTGTGYEGAQQAVHLEIWCEKTTMNDVLIPICQHHNVNLITGMGELSITAVVDFLNRVRQADRPARILYISDYDPAGLGMPVSVARKVEFFLANDGLDGYDIRLHTVALSGDQVREYSLPRTPVKDSDLRKANWTATHGAGAIKLDALEALHPGSLAAIVEDEISAYRDETLPRRAAISLQELQAMLDDEHDNILGNYAGQLDTLTADYNDLRAERDDARSKFAELVEPFEPEIEAHRAALEAITERAKTLYDEITTDLDDVEIAPPAEVEAELPPEGDAVLYNSQRDYFDQLVAYRAHRDGEAIE